MTVFMAGLFVLGLLYVVVVFGICSVAVIRCLYCLRWINKQIKELKDSHGIA